MIRRCAISARWGHNNVAFGRARGPGDFDYMSNVTASDVQNLRNRAAIARRIANEVSVEEAAESLQKQAQELEREAKELEHRR